MIAAIHWVSNVLLSKFRAGLTLGFLWPLYEGYVSLQVEAQRGL